MISKQILLISFYKKSPKFCHYSLFDYRFVEMSKVPAMNLRQFLLRNEVLKLYRNILRTIKQVPDLSSQNELRTWARHDFLQNKNVSDETAIKMLIQHGNRSLTELKNSLNLSGNTTKSL